MPNQQNVETVETFSSKFQEASGIYFTDYLGLSVKDITQLRKKFTEDGVIILEGNALGNWFAEAGTIDLLETFDCDAIAFDYNAYFTFYNYTTQYYMNVDDDTFDKKMIWLRQ